MKFVRNHRSVINLCTFTGDIYVIQIHDVWKNLWSLYESYYRFW